MKKKDLTYNDFYAEDVYCRYCQSWVLAKYEQAEAGVRKLFRQCCDDKGWAKPNHWVAWESKELVVTQHWKADPIGTELQFINQFYYLAC